MLKQKIFTFLLYVVLGATIASCKNSPPSSSVKNEKPLLLVSIPPYQSIVQQIAGDDFQVLTVAPSNADPHTYEPTVKQLSEISKGEIWFRIGEPFEQKLIPLLQKSKSVDLRQGLFMIDTHDHSHCGHDHGDTRDRHIWLSPKMVSSQITAIATTLSQQFPEQKQDFFERASLFQMQLDHLDLEIKKRLEGIVTRTFLVSHPAFAYFCREYDCHQLSIEQEGKEPRAKDIEQILKTALRTGTELAIAIPQHNNKGAQLIADKLKIPVRLINPYGDNCLETMRKLADLISDPYQTNMAP